MNWWTEMELKRYVMFDNNKIIDTVLGDYIVTNNQLYTYHFGSSEPVVANIKKTSDNILDLVEVGDLVGYRFWCEDYENIDKMRDEQNINNDIKYNGNGFVIVAIYKRQSNGDYKRYEVL